MDGLKHFFAVRACKSTGKHFLSIEKQGCLPAHSKHSSTRFAGKTRFGLPRGLPALTRLFLPCFLLIGLITSAAGQHADSLHVTKAWRAIFINPGIELEYPLGKWSTLTTHIGIGYNGIFYDELIDYSYGELWDPVYIFAPFIDLQYKAFYNRAQRARRGKSLTHNSGNFFATRLITQGPTITGNQVRKSDVDFIACLTWGLQRAYGRYHFLIDFGPQIGFDLKGNWGYYPFPFVTQVNFGINLN